MHSFETRFTSAYIAISIWRAYTMMTRRWETAAAFYLNMKGSQLYEVSVIFIRKEVFLGNILDSIKKLK